MSSVCVDVLLGSARTDCQAQHNIQPPSSILTPQLLSCGWSDRIMLMILINMYSIHLHTDIKFLYYVLYKGVETVANVRMTFLARVHHLLCIVTKCYLLLIVSSQQSLIMSCG